jgi:uncharacterized OB-fold protein
MDRPLPVPDALTGPYWKSVQERRLDLPRCTGCGKFHFYPRATCPHCGSGNLEWKTVSGRATVYSYTVVYRAPGPAFAAEVPYVVATLTLEEGPHLMSNVVGCPSDTVRIGMPVKVDFRELEGTLLPVFRPA